MHLKKIATRCPKSAKIKYSGCDFLNKSLAFCLAQKVKGKNNCALQYASFVISKFSVFSDVLVWVWSIHWNVKSDNTCGVRLKCMATSQVFVYFYGGFVISKSTFKFRCGRADILEITFLAMNQLDHIRWITRECLPNKIRFTSLLLEKVWELTKKFLQRSHLVLSQVKHPAVGTAIDGDEVLSTLRRCQNFFEVLRPVKRWKDRIRWKKLLKFWGREQKMKMLLN